uniref:Uncharacterized protein n=1 Tax=Rhizophora mucronata TaxID=61149 RepID=A0A2P2P667_RHIMU
MALVYIMARYKCNMLANFMVSHQLSEGYIWQRLLVLHPPHLSDKQMPDQRQHCIMMIMCRSLSTNQS